MITNYKKYKKIFTNIKNKEFIIKFDFVYILSDRCGIYYNIYYDNLTDVEEDKLNYTINKKLQNTIHCDEWQFTQTIPDAIYLALYLEDLNYNHNDYNLNRMFKIDIYDLNMKFAKKYKNIEEFYDDFDNIKIDNKDIFISKKIKEDNKRYFDPIYKYLISDNIKKEFEYLDNAKNFDIL